jgi:hypothetical protein
MCRLGSQGFGEDGALNLCSQTFAWPNEQGADKSMVYQTKYPQLVCVKFRVRTTPGFAPTNLQIPSSFLFASTLVRLRCKNLVENI